MPFNISTFRSNIASDGYLKGSHYEIIITPPDILNQGTIRDARFELKPSTISDSLRFRTQRVNIPGINFQTVNTRRYGVGPIQKTPLTNEFTECGISILCDRNGGIWKYWYEWMRLIFNFNGVTNAPSGQINRNATYISEYKDNFSSTAIIVFYDTTGYPVMEYELTKIYPVSISDVPLNWQIGNLIELNVLLNYKEHRMISTTINKIND